MWRTMCNCVILGIANQFLIIVLPLNHFELKLGNKNTGVGWMGQINHTFTLFIGSHSVGWGILDSLFVKIQPDIVHIVQ